MVVGQLLIGHGGLVVRDVECGYSFLRQATNEGGLNGTTRGLR